VAVAAYILATSSRDDEPGEQEQADARELAVAGPEEVAVDAAQV
jgi:hypothetical protein